MANSAQRFMSNLFNLKTDDSRNQKLEMLPAYYLQILHTHMLDSKRWDTRLVREDEKNPEQHFYNAELDVEFKYQFITEESESDGLIHYMACAKQEMNFLDKKVAGSMMYEEDMINDYFFPEESVKG